MKKKDFLKKPHVGDFVGWLSKQLCSSNLSHSWINRRNRKNVSFASVFDAFEQYSWSFKFSNPLLPPENIFFGSSFKESNTALDLIKKKLIGAIKDAIEKPDDEGAANDVRIWAQTLMRWGGVYPGNGIWLHNNQDGLAKTLDDVALLLGQDADDAELNGISRFNSGMTKIYSLLVNDFIIYDTRVAAALTWIIRRYCERNELQEVPEYLRFPVGSAKESPKAKDPKCRNPSKDSLTFPALRSGSNHAMWNLRASWLLRAVLNEAASESCFRKLDSEIQLRALEAALFMIGYDIPGGGVSNKQIVLRAEESAPITDSGRIDNSFPLETRGGKKIAFRYEITDSGLIIHNEKKRSLKEVSFEQLECIFKTLSRNFEDRFFPLENNRIRASSGTLGDGLGSAAINCGIDDHTYASYIGPILEDLSFFEWNGRRKGIEWRLVDQPASAADIKEQILQNLDA